MTHRPVRRLLARASAAVLAGALVVVGAAAPALAEPSGKIVQIGSSNGTLQIVFTALGLSPGQTLDPASAAVSVEGTSLTGVTAKQPDGGTATLVNRTAVLVMDTSGSMQKTIGPAKAAAIEYVKALPADVKIGLLTFETTVHPLVSPTADRKRILAAINAVNYNPTGSTALYDGLIAGSRLAGTKGIRNLVLLSDGGDTTSKASAAQARSTLVNSKVSVDAVTLAGSNNAILLSLVRPTGGQLIPAGDASNLSKAFAQAAQSISNQLFIIAPLPADLTSTSGNVTVQAKAGDATLQDTSFTTFTKATAAATADANAYGPKPVAIKEPLLGKNALPFALGALFLGLAVLLLIAFSSVGNQDGREGRVRRRLSLYTFTGRQPVKQQETTALGDSNVARSAVEFAGKVVAKRDFEQVLGLRLEAAGVPLRPAEWLLIHVGATLGMGLFFLLLFGGSLIPALIGVALGFLAPYLYLSTKESRRTNAFLAQLPDTLQLLAGSLSAGYSLPQAVDTVVREGQPPITVEFNRALVEARLGVPLEDALDGVATRMKSKDFSWVVMAIRIQREVGGNLAEVLSTVAATLRERERLRRQVQVLSAEGRLSAWILGLLPAVFALYLVLVRPEYLKPLVSEPIGWVMIVVGSVLLITGALWLRKVVRVEV